MGSPGELTAEHEPFGRRNNPFGAAHGPRARSVPAAAGKATPGGFGALSADAREGEQHATQRASTFSPAR
jgi:hypothetical protein